MTYNSTMTGSGARDSVWVIVTCFAAALVPLLLSRSPALMDYPNHLARIWLIAEGAADPALEGSYIIDWGRASTNVAVDWVAASLAQMMSFGAVDRLLRIAMFLGPALGAALLARRVHGRLSVWHAAPLAFVWGTTSIAGFLNYSVSLGLALLGAYAFILSQSFRPMLRAVLHLAIATVILAVHPFGFGFYVALVAGLSIGPQPIWRSSGAILAARLGPIAGYPALAALPLLLMSWLAPNPPRTDGIVFPSVADMTNPLSIAKTLLSPVLGYDLVIDVALLVPLVVCLALALRQKAIRVHFGLALIAVLLAVGALVAPLEIGDASWLNRRLPLMSVLTACVAFQPDIEGSRRRKLLVQLLLLAVLGRIGWTGFIWFERDRDLGDLMAATPGVAPGDPVIVLYAAARISEDAPRGRYVVGAAGEPRPVRRHLASMLVPNRKLLVPTLFSIEGQHPLRVSEPLGPTSANILSTDEWRQQLAIPAYLENWPCKFRYIVVLGVDEEHAGLEESPYLFRAASKRFAELYRIDARSADCGNDTTPPALPRE